MEICVILKHLKGTQDRIYTNSRISAIKTNEVFNIIDIKIPIPHEKQKVQLQLVRLNIKLHLSNNEKHHLPHVCITFWLQQNGICLNQY